MVAGEVDGVGRGVLVEGEEGAGGEQWLVAAFGDQNALHVVQEFGAAVSGEGQGAPGDAQADTEGCRVGAVPADVADNGLEQSVVALDDVEEVSAEQCELGAGEVARGDRDGRGVEDRMGQQTSFQADIFPARRRAACASAVARSVWLR